MASPFNFSRFRPLKKTLQKQRVFPHCVSNNRSELESLLWLKFNYHCTRIFDSGVKSCCSFPFCFSRVYRVDFNPQLYVPARNPSVIIFNPGSTHWTECILFTRFYSFALRKSGLICPQSDTSDTTRCIHNSDNTSPGQWFPESHQHVHSLSTGFIIHIHPRISVYHEYTALEWTLLF